MQAAQGIRWKNWLTVLAVSLGLVACGGEGGSGSGNEPPPVAGPAITTQPANVSINDGQVASFSVAASGQGLSYQWTRNGTPISGATAASYSTSAQTLSDSGARFAVTVSGTGGSVTSSEATLTVRAVAPSIGQQPQSAGVTAGQTASFSVLANGSQPLTFQWLRNGTAIAGATSASYTTGTLAVADNGARYAVRISNSAGSLDSAEATLSVTAVALVPVIGTSPAAASVTEGSTATFSVTVTGGTAPFSYQWLRNGAAIAGATSASYTTGAQALSDSGAQFSVRVSNAAGSVVSANALLTVMAAPVASSSPQRIHVGQGRAAAIRADGSVLNWGLDTVGQLGSGAALAGSNARQVDTTGTQVALGTYETVVLGLDGIVRGWGAKYTGTSLIGGTIGMTGTAVPSPVATTFPTGITQVVTGNGNFALALRNDGTVWHLPGTTVVEGGVTRHVASQVPGLGNVASLSRGAGGQGVLMAVLRDGSVSAVKILASGPLGWRASAVVQPAVTGALQASCQGTASAADYACIALKRDGTVIGWNLDAPAATPVSGLRDVVQVAATNDSFHAITRDGRLWSWGRGDRSGIAGDAFYVDSPTVVPSLSNVVEVAGGFWTVLVRLADGSVWAFGTNVGEFGDGTNVSSRVPVRVPGINLN